MKRILWPVDPFVKNTKLHRSVCKMIREFSAKPGAVIEPVYLLQSSFPLDTPNHPLVKEIERAFAKLLVGTKLKNLLPLKIVNNSSLSLRAGVKMLIDHAKESKADLIVLGTHAKTGVPSWFIGSFAETLMLYSTVPFLLVNPHWKRVPNFKHIMFTTDFSKASENAFHRVLDLARLLKSKVIVFNKPVLVSGVPASFGWIPFPDISAAETAKAHQEGARWAKLGAGVPIEIIIDKNNKTTVVEAILAANKKKPGLIAMAAQTSQLESVLLGSVTRQVVKESPEPVWVIHPSKAGG